MYIRKARYANRGLSLGHISLVYWCINYFDAKLQDHVADHIFTQVSCIHYLEYLVREKMLFSFCDLLVTDRLEQYVFMCTIIQTEEK